MPNIYIYYMYIIHIVWDHWNNDDLMYTIILTVLNIYIWYKYIYIIHIFFFLSFLYVGIPQKTSSLAVTIVTMAFADFRFPDLATDMDLQRLISPPCFQGWNMFKKWWVPWMWTLESLDMMWTFTNFLRYNDVNSHEISDHDSYHV